MFRVTTMRSCCWAVAAMKASVTLIGQPVARPRAVMRPHLGAPTSASNGAAPVPSITVPLRMTGLRSLMACFLSDFLPGGSPAAQLVKNRAG